MNPVDHDLRRAIGALLREARTRRGWSLAKAAQESGHAFPAVVIGSYERGDRAITADRLIALGELYGVPAADLLPGDGKGTAEQREAQALHAFGDWAHARARALLEDAT